MITSPGSSLSSFYQHFFIISSSFHYFSSSWLFCQYFLIISSSLSFHYYFIIFIILWLFHHFHYLIIIWSFSSNPIRYSRGHPYQTVGYTTLTPRAHPLNDRSTRVVRWSVWVGCVWRRWSYIRGGSLQQRRSLHWK